VFEVGCGEGRVARDLRARGYEVTGLDVAPTLVEAARDADPSGTYVVGDAAALPFGDASFDLVVSYNSLIDVDDMPAAVAEAGRVLRPGGCFCACVPHPFSEAGEFEGSADDAPLFVAGSYLLEADYELVSDREGIVFRFASRRSHSSHIRAHSNPAGSRSRRCASRHFRAPRAIDGPVCRCSSCGGP
jgi:ubiquinone/menaquinone biosynthesis C-methylase UbiE